MHVHRTSPAGATPATTLEDLITSVDQLRVIRGLPTDTDIPLWEACASLETMRADAVLVMVR